MPVYASFDYYPGHLSILTPGKRYLTRSHPTVDNGFYLTDDEGDELYCSWRGCRFLGDTRDWIRHEDPDAEPEPEVGTIPELNLRPGDVVELIAHKGGEWVGTRAVVDEDGWPIGDDGLIFGPNLDGYFKRKWRVVSRAEPTPDFNLPPMPDARALADAYVEHKAVLESHLNVSTPDAFVLHRTANGGWLVVSDSTEATPILAAFTNTADLIAGLPEMLGSAR